MKLLFVNDRRVYNSRYRSGLIDILTSHRCDVCSVGVFDSLLKVCFLLLYNRKRHIVSSNLKSNLLVSLLSPKNRSLIIVNGLGRWRQLRIARTLMLYLLVHRNAALIFQNYADYRFTRLHFKTARIHWVCGSGGSVRKVSTTGADFFCVSRNEKLNTVIESLICFINVFECSNINVVGVDRVDADTLNLVTGTELSLVGYVRQENILNHGASFVQLSGYGEGFPHSLADALVTGLPVVIEKSQFVCFGLNKIGFVYDILRDNWVRISPDQDATTNTLDEVTINQQYADIISKTFGH